MNNKIVTLIPCAGLGSRMGMATNRSKELILNPETNKPLIAWTLEHAVNPLLIIRKEKQDLIDYAEHKKINYITMEATKEWPQTILNAGYKWGEYNLLMLPDTQFSDASYAISSVVGGLRENALSFGIHYVNDLSKWGVVDFDSTEEKPQRYTGLHYSYGWAWGIIGFRRSIGQDLFVAYGNRKRYEFYPEATSFTKMHWFKDVTR